jgi:PAS domain S-box-containing protein
MRPALQSRLIAPYSVIATLAVGGLVTLWLLVLGRHDYPNLHTILDAGCCLLAGILGVSLWGIGGRTEQVLPKWLAISFAVAFLAELVHTAVTIDWFGSLGAIASAEPVLRPSTWPIAAYILPVGVGSAVWLSPRRRERLPAFVLAMLALVALMFPIFYTLPRYTDPLWPGITRPLLVGVPILWMGVAWTCWRHRAADRLFPMLALMSVVLVGAHASMLYSRAPHDTQAMMAHLGKLIGFLALLLLLMQSAAADMLERIRSERVLAGLNVALERRVAERTAELQLAYQSARAIADTAFDGVIVMDGQGLITQFNPAAERIFGVRADGVIGRALADTLIPPPMRESHRTGLARYLATGQAAILGRRLELDGLRADGTLVPLELTVNRILGAQGVAFAGFVRDLTERKKEEALRAHHAAIIESSDDAIVGKTLQGIVSSWNAGAERLFGYTADEMIGQPLQRLLPPERADEETEILARIASGQRIDHFETVRITKDGRRVDVSVSISPIADASGKIVGASKIARDVTERKQTEQKLAMQLARHDLLNRITRAMAQRQDLHSILQVCVRSLEENLPIDFGCACLYDPLAEALTISCVGVRSSGLALELGMPQNAQVPIDQNGLSRCVAGSLTYEPDLEQVSNFPFPRRLASAGLRSLVAAPLIVESRVFGVLVTARRAPRAFSSGECEFLRQLSEHVALAAHQAEIHEELQRAYEDLRQTQQAVMQQERLRALGQMASGIAHDINNAISPVALYTDLLIEREPTLSEPGREQLRVIQRAIGDVEQTLARMREFYRQREPQLGLVPIQITHLVQQVMDLTRARWRDIPQQEGIVIEPAIELAPALPTIMGVEAEIREALTNLVFNAADAMPGGGTLRVRTGVSAAAAEVYVEVSDTGVGMDEDTRRRCMEPFFTTKGARGTGMGLAMVYGVVQRHSAEIAIDSTPGVGTTVRMTFASRSAALADSVEPDEAKWMQARLRILVIDDDPLLLKSLRDTLEADGHLVTTANGGREGIEVFSAACQRGEPFPVVITDLGMPYVDGRSVARAVKTASTDAVVILLTGWGQRLVSDGDVPAHVDKVLSKPPKLRMLRQALAQCGEPGGQHLDA